MTLGKNATMPKLARIHIHPIKSFDQQSVAEATLLSSGALEHDRRFALYDPQGKVVNAKRTPVVHHLRSLFDPATNCWTLRVEGSNEERCFEICQDRDKLLHWLSGFFGTRLTLAENSEAGFPDDTESPGPTVTSSGTMAAVGRWFGDLPLDDVRRRFRANLEIDASEPFWEDQLVADWGAWSASKLAMPNCWARIPASAARCRPRDPDTGGPGRPYRSFRGLLDHLATLTRNQVRFASATATVPMLAEPTSTQRHAFELSVPRSRSP